MTLSDCVRSRVFAAALLALAAMVVCLGGCGTSYPRVHAFAAGAAPSGVAVDAVNDAGPITITADPSIQRIRVEADLHVSSEVPEEERAALAEAVEFEMDLEGEPPRQTLRVRVASPRPETRDVRVHLRVRAPSVRGVLARNERGHIVLEGVAGAIQAESVEGSIEVRTDRRLDQPVALVTEGGNILFKAPPETQGFFELKSGREGRVGFDSAVVLPADVYASQGYWRGLVNEGANPVYLESQTGSVRVWIREDPMLLIHSYK
jgi:hypothetical protein